MNELTELEREAKFEEEYFSGELRAALADARQRIAELERQHAVDAAQIASLRAALKAANEAVDEVLEAVLG